MDNLRMPGDKRRRVDVPDLPPVVAQRPIVDEPLILTITKNLVQNGFPEDPSQWGTVWVTRLVKLVRMALAEARLKDIQVDALEDSALPEILWQVEKLAKGLEGEFRKELEKR